MNTVGARLRALRERVGYSVRAAATAVGMKTPSGWKHYEDDHIRESIPADMAIDLYREWLGKGTPPVSAEEILRLSPSLFQLFKDTGHHFNSEIALERENIKMVISIEARELYDVRKVIERLAELSERKPHTKL